MDDSEISIPPARLRVMQMIAGAIPAGATAFLLIVLFLVQIQNGGRGFAPQGPPVVSILAAAMLAITAVLSYVVPTRLVRQALRKKAPADAASRLPALRHVSLIVGLALLEGAAFFGCMAYFLEGRPLALGVPVVAILLMLLRFPTEYGVRTWMRRQLDSVETTREEAGPADAP